MKFNSKTLGALLAIAAFSFTTACSGETEVRYVEVPATASEADEAVVDATEPKVTEPETTDVPFTLPIPPTTQAPAPVVTAAPAPLPPVVDTYNDGILDDLEYSIVVQVLNDGGYGYLVDGVDRGTAEELGVTICDLATGMDTVDELLVVLLETSAGTYTPEEAGSLAGMTALICKDEMNRLGMGW